MAKLDPRQRGLFAAAWAVGAVAATATHRVSSLAVSCFVGPFGMIYERAPWSQPVYDDFDNAAVYPIFHVVRALLQMAGAQRLSLSEVTEGLVGIAAAGGTSDQLILANLADDAREIRLPRAALVRQLGPEAFHAAITDPNWLTTSEHAWHSEFALERFGVAFIEMHRSAA